MPLPFFSQAPIKGIRGWFFYRLIGNYWSLPMVAVLAAPLIAGAVLWADHAFLSEWMRKNGLGIIASAETAKDLSGIAVGIDAAFITLYFSITLIVLTLATGNLGARLIDRWLDKPLVRISMSGLAFSLVYALIVLAAIDPQGDAKSLPMFALLGVIVLQLINVAMLGVALHDLGRTMFIDTSVALLAEDARDIGLQLVAGTPRKGEWRQTVKARREGYVEGIDLDRLDAILKGGAGCVRFVAAPGAHVLVGETLVKLEHDGIDEETVQRAIAIGDHRSDGQGAVFQIRLLVEIAARALSPGINDYFTALACADKLTHAMQGHAGHWVDEGRVALYGRALRFELPGQDMRALFEKPLNQFRQAAAPYPSVAIRMIENYERLVISFREEARPEQLIAFLRDQSDALAEHAMTEAGFERDRADIQHAADRVHEMRATD